MITTSSFEQVAPQRYKMTYKEYLEFASGSQIMEWVEGEVVIYMPPRREHQALLLFLSELLNAFINFFDLGTLILAPFEVKLWPDGPSREPDLLFVSQEQLSNLRPERFEGGPDLVIEIISPSSVTEDRVRKFTEYEQAGVREYWLIDSRPYQQQADFYTLDDEGKYQSVSLGEDGIYRSTVLSHFWLDINWLQAETLSNPQLALAKIMMSIPELPAEVKDAYEALYEVLRNDR